MEYTLKIKRNANDFHKLSCISCPRSHDPGQVKYAQGIFWTIFERGFWQIVTKSIFNMKYTIDFASLHSFLPKYNFPFWVSFDFDCTSVNYNLYKLIPKIYQLLDIARSTFKKENGNCTQKWMVCCSMGEAVLFHEKILGEYTCCPTSESISTLKLTQSSGQTLILKHLQLVRKTFPVNTLCLWVVTFPVSYCFVSRLRQPWGAKWTNMLVLTRDKALTIGLVTPEHWWKENVCSNSIMLGQLLSTMKQEDNKIGSVRPSVHLYVCIRGSALPSAAKSNRSHYQSKVIVCVSVISRRVRSIARMRSIGVLIINQFVLYKCFS